MKTITINLYKYEELSPRAKARALEDYREDDNTPFLTDDLREYIHEELTERGFKVGGVATSANPTIVPMYSLSHCQGDGLMFEGVVIDPKGNIYTIEHIGHYYHERETFITGVDKNGNKINTEAFNNDIYIPICKKVRDMGYSILEEADSEEAFIQQCEANDYTFEENGLMRNS